MKRGWVWICLTVIFISALPALAQSNGESVLQNGLDYFAECDYSRAVSRFDLVMRDFPGTDAAYKAAVMKIFSLCVRYSADRQAFDAFTSGLQNALSNETKIKYYQMNQEAVLRLNADANLLRNALSLALSLAPRSDLTLDISFKQLTSEMLTASRFVDKGLPLSIQEENDVQEGYKTIAQGSVLALAFNFSPQQIATTGASKLHCRVQLERLLLTHCDVLTHAAAMVAVYYRDRVNAQPFFRAMVSVADRVLSLTRNDPYSEVHLRAQERKNEALAEIAKDGGTAV